MRTRDSSLSRFILGLLIVFFLGTTAHAKNDMPAAVSTDVLDLIDSRPNIEIGVAFAGSIEFFLGMYYLEATRPTDQEKINVLDAYAGLGFFVNTVYKTGLYTRFSTFFLRQEFATAVNDDDDEEDEPPYKGTISTPVKWSLGYATTFGKRGRLQFGIVPGYFHRGGDFDRTFMRDDSDDEIADEAQSSDFEVRIGYLLD